MCAAARRRNDGDCPIGTLEDFDGKCVVVTGASRGIGRALVRALVEKGATVAASARSLTDLEETKASTICPDRVHLCPGDLRSLTDVEAIAAAARRHLGAIDILMNVAGVWHDSNRRYQGPLLAETPAGDIDEVLDVGLRGPFHLTRLLLPEMIRVAAGKVIFIACGFAGPAEAIGWTHYYVANKAIEALVAGLGAELRRHNIQVNGIAPWFVATEAVERFYPEQAADALPPAEVVAMALFLASARADHISGQTVELRSKRDL